MDFCTWKDLTQYNEIALVGIFQDGLNKGLARKLVELGQLNKMSSLDIWYIKVVEFEIDDQWKGYLVREDNS